MKVECEKCCRIIDETEYMQFGGLCISCMRKNKKKKGQEFRFPFQALEEIDRNH